MKKFKKPTNTDIAIAQWAVKQLKDRKCTDLNNYHVYNHYFFSSNKKELGDPICKVFCNKKIIKFLRKYNVNTIEIEPYTILNNGYTLHLISYEADKKYGWTKDTVAQISKAERAKKASNSDRSVYVKTSLKHKGKKVWKVWITKRGESDEATGYYVLCEENGTALLTKYAAIFCSDWNQNHPRALARFLEPEYAREVHQKALRDKKVIK